MELTDIDGIGPSRSDSLVHNGYESVVDVSTATPDEIANAASVSESTAEDIIEHAELIVVSNSDPTYTVQLIFGSADQYDAYFVSLHNALTERRNDENAVASIEESLDAARYAQSSFEQEMTAYTLNLVHGAVAKQRKKYKRRGDDRYEQATLRVLEQIEEYRQQYLF